ncbi:MAG: Uncharacterised protein [Cryomorphaceae bacterium]|nr:MAG: Uncharacterised protein [Cryomorphaceae bacterium]|tara:strand:- start:463 stop:1269 length:807 start_codon:yes stop_codon:yes gene_type:complete
MKKTFLAICSIAVLLYACKDEDVINNPDLESTQATQDHLFAEQTFNDVSRIVKEGFLESGASKSCASYNLINNNSLDIDTLIINFGTTNCLQNGKLRKGKVVITYSGGYHDSLAIITTTFDNYHINNNLVQGEIVVINQGKNNNGNMHFTTSVNNASIITNNGIINWSTNRTREWVSGIATYGDLSDDKYNITGTANGIGVNNNSFSVEIIDTLKIDLGCLPSCVINKGNAKISPNGYTDRIINYGDSLCDCNFDITINEKNYPLLLN